MSFGQRPRPLSGLTRFLSSLLSPQSRGQLVPWGEGKHSQGRRGGLRGASGGGNTDGRAALHLSRAVANLRTYTGKPRNRNSRRKRREKARL